MNSQGSLVSGIVWMCCLSVLLFWLPGFGPLLAGVVGGKKSGGIGNALLAVVLPGLVLGVLLVLCSAMFTGIPVLGVILGAGGLVFYFSHIGMLLVGAVIGSLLA